MKKFLSLLLCLSLVFGMTANAYAQTGITENISPVSSLFLEEQDRSNESYNRLLVAFANEGNAERIDQNFPDYYAGAYIDSEDGHLVILHAGAEAADLEYMKSVCSNDKVEFEEAQYSLNELLSIRDKIVGASETMAAKASATSIMETAAVDPVVNATSIRENENSIYVGLSSVSNETISNLSKEFIQAYGDTVETNGSEGIAAVQEGIISGEILSIENMLPVKFYLEEDTHIIKEASLMPGDRIEYSLGFLQGTVYGSAGFYGSIMYEGTKRWGFFTAGHNIEPKPTAVIENEDGDDVGKALVYENTDSVDAGFVEMTGYGSSFSNKVDGIQLTAGVFVIPAIGSTIYKVGQTTGKTWGTVISNLNSGPGYQDMVEATYSSNTGDSGGLVYTLSSGEAKVVGLHTGQYGSYRYATKAAYIGWSAAVT